MTTRDTGGERGPDPSFPAGVAILNCALGCPTGKKSAILGSKKEQTPPGVHTQPIRGALKAEGVRIDSVKSSKRTSGRRKAARVASAAVVAGALDRRILNGELPVAPLGGTEIKVVMLHEVSTAMVIIRTDVVLLKLWWFLPTKWDGSLVSF